VDSDAPAAEPLPNGEADQQQSGVHFSGVDRANPRRRGIYGGDCATVVSCGGECGAADVIGKRCQCSWEKFTLPLRAPPRSVPVRCRSRPRSYGSLQVISAQGWRGADALQQVRLFWLQFTESPEDVKNFQKLCCVLGRPARRLDIA